MSKRTSRPQDQGGAEGVSLVQDPNARTSATRSALPSNGIVSGEARRNQPNLDVGSSVFGKSAIRGLIDEWLVPMVVDSIIHDLICSGTADEER